VTGSLILTQGPYRNEQGFPKGNKLSASAHLGRRYCRRCGQYICSYSGLAIQERVMLGGLDNMGPVDDMRGTRYGLARLIAQTRLDPEQRAMFCRGTRPFVVSCFSIALSLRSGAQGRCHAYTTEGCTGGMADRDMWRQMQRNPESTRAIRGRVAAFAQGARRWVGWGRCLSRLEPAYPSALCGRGAAAAEQLLERSEPEFLAGNRGQHVGLPRGRRPPLQQAGSTERATEGPGTLLGGEVSSSLAPCR
jgi:hypothetical protein